MSEKKTRAANGTGSIRQRSDGRWEARYTAPDGRQKSVYAPSEKEARKRLKAAQAEITLGLYVEPSRVTVDKWVDAWLKDYVCQHKPNTQKSYRSLMENHVIPTIGKMKLSAINTGTIRRLFGQMSNKGLAPSTIKATKIALSSCMSAAVENKLIKENPCHGAKVKKPPKKQLIFVDRKDFPAFITETKKQRYSVAILTLFQTGIRSGEMRGLRWADFDEQKAELNIRRQIIETDAGPIVQTPKDDECRTIALTPDMVTILKRHRSHQAELKLKYAWKDTPITKDLIFRTRDGDVYRQSKLYYTVQRIGQKIGIEGLHPHSLRDSYAIAALRAGVDIKTISNNLGHADTSMTLNKYMAYTDDMGRIAAEKYALYLRENSSI